MRIKHQINLTYIFLIDENYVAPELLYIYSDNHEAVLRIFIDIHICDELTYQ